MNFRRDRNEHNSLKEEMRRASDPKTPLAEIDYYSRSANPSIVLAAVGNPAATAQTLHKVAVEYSNVNIHDQNGMIINFTAISILRAIALHNNASLETEKLLIASIHPTVREALVVKENPSQIIVACLRFDSYPHIRTAVHERLFEDLFELIETSRGPEDFLRALEEWKRD